MKDKPEQHFRKVFIKTEDDLPELLNRNYFVSLKNGGKGVFYLEDSGDVEEWLVNVDWYLQTYTPASEQVVKKQENWGLILKKIRIKVKKQVGIRQLSGFKLLTNYYPTDAFDQIDDIFKIIASELSSLREGGGEEQTGLLKEYASQAQVPSEEEIERWAKSTANEADKEGWAYNLCMELRIEGANWVINNIKSKNEQVR